MKLYKYTRFDIGKQIISSSQIALSKPQDFNDPFDCVPVSIEDDLRKAIEILNGYAIDQTIFESLQEVKDKINKPLQKALVSFVLWEYRIARKLAKRKPMAYSPIFTFEKFDKFFRLCERLGKVSPEQIQEKEKLAYMQSVIEQQEWVTIHKMANQRDSIYVACLSAVYDSILMWSYYGQDHKGVCIEFEIEEDPRMLSKVEYCAERPTVQMEKLMKDLCGKIFAQKSSSEINEDPVLLPLVVQPYISKAKEWEHEQEYRLIFPEQILDELNIKKKMCSDGKERYMYDVKITKVFLGAAMPKEHKLELLNIIPSEINVVEMAISNSKYELISTIH